MTSTTQLSMNLLRRDGWTVWRAERWNSFANKREDAFGFGDILAVKYGEPGVWAIQATTRGEISKRRNKIKASPEAEVWLKAGNKISIWGWLKVDHRWTVKEEVIESG